MKNLNKETLIEVKFRLATKAFDLMPKFHGTQRIEAANAMSKELINEVDRMIRKAE